MMVASVGSMALMASMASMALDVIAFKIAQLGGWLVFKVIIQVGSCLLGCSVRSIGASRECTAGSMNQCCCSAKRWRLYKNGTAAVAPNLFPHLSRTGHNLQVLACASSFTTSNLLLSLVRPLTMSSPTPS